MEQILTFNKVLKTQLRRFDRVKQHLDANIEWDLNYLLNEWNGMIPGGDHVLFVSFYSQSSKRILPQILQHSKTEIIPILCEVGILRVNYMCDRQQSLFVLSSNYQTFNTGIWSKCINWIFKMIQLFGNTFRSVSFCRNKYGHKLYEHPDFLTNGEYRKPVVMKDGWKIIFQSY